MNERSIQETELNQRNEQGIFLSQLQDDPSKNPSNYRFRVGDLVIYTIREHEQQPNKSLRNTWFQGTVVKVCQRIPNNNNNNYKRIAYVVRPQNIDKSQVIIFEDTHDEIRPRPTDLTPDPFQCKATQISPFHDPLYYLYTNTPKLDCNTKEGIHISDMLKNYYPNIIHNNNDNNNNNESKINPDGSANIQLIPNNQTLTAKISKVPPFVKNYHGRVGTNTIIHMIHNFIHMRKEYHINLNHYHYGSFHNFQKLVESIIPTASNSTNTSATDTILAKLEKEAKTCNTKMLQLADYLRLNIHNNNNNNNNNTQGNNENDKDYNYKRSTTLYRAAAFGCTEEEVSTTIHSSNYITNTDILPINGIPEAMVAVAILHYFHIRKVLGYQDWACIGNYCESVKKALGNDVALASLFIVFWWLKHAMYIHGYVSSFTLVMADAIHKIHLLHHLQTIGGSSSVSSTSTSRWDEFKNMCISILRAKEYRAKEMEFQDMQLQGEIPRGDTPLYDYNNNNKNNNHNHFELFESKALQIFENLPKNNDTLHIEFNQVQVPCIPPSIIIAMVCIPSLRKIVKIIPLPDRLQNTPFSQESFQYVWTRIAYDVHLGRLRTNHRVRPATFSIPDTHVGNKAFADFLKNVLKDSNTNVQLVSHMLFIKHKKRKKMTIRQIVSDLTTKFVEIPGFLYTTSPNDANDFDSIQRIQQEILGPSLDDTEQEQNHVNRIQEAEQLKQEGNQCFIRQDFMAAIRCYSTALDHMKRVIQHNQTTYQLLGTLLSNRSACFIGYSYESDFLDSIKFRKVLSMYAIKDCDAALENSSILSSLPPSILGKLRFRRDRAFVDYDNICSELNASVDPFLSSSEANNGGDMNGVLESDEQFDDYIVPESFRTHMRQKHIDTGVDDAIIEYGEDIFQNYLAKNATDGCPVCQEAFNGELSKTYVIVWPCGEHALCSTCTCTLKKQADKDKQMPECPLCRYKINPEFIQNIPSQMIEKDQEIANLILQLPALEGLNDQISVAERLLWHHDFNHSKVVDSLNHLLDSQVSGSFFRPTGDLNHEQKTEIYRQARVPVERLEEKINNVLKELKITYENQKSVKINNELRKLRHQLAVARKKAREDIYIHMNSVGNMGVQQEGSKLIQVDYHGLHVADMNIKFKEDIIPILPVFKKVMIITGRGSHSVGKESKLKKALVKLVAQYESHMYWQPVDKNPGALYVCWRVNK